MKRVLVNLRLSPLSLALTNVGLRSPAQQHRGTHMSPMDMWLAMQSNFVPPVRRFKRVIKS